MRGGNLCGMTYPRCTLVSPGARGVFHCVSRCVRRVVRAADGLVVVHAHIVGTDCAPGEQGRHLQGAFLGRFLLLQNLHRAHPCASEGRDAHRPPVLRETARLEVSDRDAARPSDYGAVVDACYRREPLETSCAIRLPRCAVLGILMYPHVHCGSCAAHGCASVAGAGCAGATAPCALHSNRAGGF